MRTLTVLSLTALLASPLTAQGNPDPDKNVKGSGSLPAGWSARLDKATDSLQNLKFGPMGPGMHVTTGPSGIFWRSEDAVPGSFHTVATFTQTKALVTHHEAMGIFVAGKDINGATASYVYLIVRGDGMFSVRQGGAVGAGSTNLTTGGNRNGWLASEAVVKTDSAGKATNTLEVSGDAASKKLTFKINGKEVAQIDAPNGQVGGLVGLRVNHNLDVHVAGFAVHKM